MSSFKVDLEMTNNIEMWLVCEAMGKNHHLVDKMQKNEDGAYPVIFSVGGVELDFNLIAKRLKEEIDRLVINRSQALLNEKYGDLIGEIIDVQNRIKAQRERFMYDWEEE